MKMIISALFIAVVTSVALASDEIEKKSSVAIRGNTKTETDTYLQGGERVLEVKRVISLRDDNHMTQQKVYWHGSLAVEFDIVHFTANPGQFLRFHAIPGVDAVTDGEPNGSLKGISLVSTNLIGLRTFKIVDGLLSPMPMSEVQRANELQEEVKDLFGDFQTGKASPSQFMGRVTGIVNKYQSDGGTTNGSTVRGQAPLP